MDKIDGKQCGRCGYDLTGLDFEGRCPECGGNYSSWSGDGIAGGVMDKHRRGEWVVRLFQTIGLVFLALALVGLGVLFHLKNGLMMPIVMTSVVALIFLAMAVNIGLSLRRR